MLVCERACLLHTQGKTRQKNRRKLQTSMTEAWTGECSRLGAGETGEVPADFRSVWVELGTDPTVAVKPRW